MTSSSATFKALSACFILLALSALLLFAGIRTYDELTQPESVPDRLEPWPTRAATIFILIVWALLVPFAATILARLARIRTEPVVAFSFVVMLAGLLPLVFLVSHINTCNTEIGFPFETSC